MRCFHFHSITIITHPWIKFTWFWVWIYQNKFKIKRRLSKGYIIDIIEKYWSNIIFVTSANFDSRYEGNHIRKFLAKTPNNIIRALSSAILPLFCLFWNIVIYYSKIWCRTALFWQKTVFKKVYNLVYISNYFWTSVSIWGPTSFLPFLRLIWSQL